MKDCTKQPSMFVAFLPALQAVFASMLVIWLRRDGFESDYLWGWVFSAAFAIGFAGLLLFQVQKIGGYFSGPEKDSIVLPIATLVAILGVASICIIPIQPILGRIAILTFVAVTIAYVLSSITKKWLANGNILTVLFSALLCVLMLIGYLYLEIRFSWFGQLARYLAAEGYPIRGDKGLTLLWMFLFTLSALIWRFSKNHDASSKDTGNTLLYALFVLMAFTLAITFVFTYDHYLTYDSLWSPELDMAARRHRDSEFHLALIQSLKDVGYPSTGQDGLRFTFYHMISHAFAGGADRFIGMKAEAMLLAFRAIIFPSIFTLIGTLAFRYSISSSETYDEKLVNIASVCASFLFAIFIYRLHHSFVAFPTPIAICIMFSLLPIYMHELKGDQRAVSLKSIFVVLGAGFVLAFTKVSFAYAVLSTFGVIILIRSGLARLTWIYAGVSLAILGLSFGLFTFFYPASSDGGAFQISGTQAFFANFLTRSLYWR